METFNNFKELMEYDSELAQELLKEKGKGRWQEEEVYYHATIEDYAEYELYDGWYADIFKDDYNSAPDPLDFINLKEFGNALANSWDYGINYKTSHGEVLQTTYGW